MNQKQENIVKAVSNACLASGRKLIAGIERAKQNLAAEFQNRLELPERLFRLAVNEAEALASETEYPQLVFPTLAVEKIQKVSAWYSRGER
jgi:hypothetical protein